MSGVARAGNNRERDEAAGADAMRRGALGKSLRKAAGQQDHAEQRQKDRGTDGRHGAFGHLAPENSGQAIARASRSPVGA